MIEAHSGIIIVAALDFDIIVFRPITVFWRVQHTKLKMLVMEPVQYSTLRVLLTFRPSAYLKELHGYMHPTDNLRIDRPQM